MRLDVEIIDKPAASHWASDSFSRMPNANAGNVDNDYEALFYCMKDCKGLEATDSDLLPADCDQHVEVLTIVERHDSYTEVPGYPSHRKVPSTQK